jgi:ribosomal protein S18 acetylase RimI-like enzyme
MTAARQTPRPEGRIRPLDPFRDLESVVDLIGVAFGDRLDPAGEATLARMRRFARGGPLLQWLWAFLGTATVAPGVVWVMDGRIVGNLSMRRARSLGGYLIGNVVVHPDERGKGIASALMEAAIKAIRRRGAHWVGLEVRADNEVARGLYERLGFQEVGRTHHFLRAGGSEGGDRPPRSELMRPGRRRDGDALVRLMCAVIPEEQRPLLEIQEDDYRPGWRRRVEHWLRCEDEAWWIVAGNGGPEMKGAVRTVQRRGAFPNRMEVLVRPGDNAGFEADLVRQGVANLGRSSRKPIETSLPEATDSLVAALKGEGFRRLRVLIQMKRSLRRRFSVPVR